MSNANFEPLNLEDLLSEKQAVQHPNSIEDDYLDNFVRYPQGDGSVVIRLLPPAPRGLFGDKKNPFYQRTKTHRLNGKNWHCHKEYDENKQRWVGHCPICDVYSYFWKVIEKMPEGDEKETKKKQAREFKPVERYYFNCIVRSQIGKNGAKEENVGPKILSIGKQIFDVIINGMFGNVEMDEEALGDVTDIVKGYDFKIVKIIKKSPDGEFPTYTSSKFLNKQSPLGDPEQIAGWIKNMHDLSSLRKLEDKEVLKHQLRIYFGSATDDAKTSDFDPSEYNLEKPQNKSSVVEVRQPLPKAQVESTPEPKKSPVSFDADEVLSKANQPEVDSESGDDDEDFMAKVRREMAK